MKESDLHREWARVLDMCEGTNVDPTKCWKLGGKLPMYYPDFGADPVKYKFAVAILEGKPVFVGDKVFHKSGKEWVVFGDANIQIIIWSEYSWNPPKKTFMLNGEELPFPVKKFYGEVKSSFSLGAFCEYSFDTLDDCNKVLNAINKLLRDNTK